MRRKGSLQERSWWRLVEEEHYLASELTLADEAAAVLGRSLRNEALLWQKLDQIKLFSAARGPAGPWWSTGTWQMLGEGGASFMPTVNRTFYFVSAPDIPSSLFAMNCCVVLPANITDPAFSKGIAGGVTDQREIFFKF